MISSLDDAIYIMVSSGRATLAGHRLAVAEGLRAQSQRRHRRRGSQAVQQLPATPLRNVAELWRVQLIEAYGRQATGPADPISVIPVSGTL